MFCISIISRPFNSFRPVLAGTAPLNIDGKRLLSQYGELFRRQVVDLKKQGYKTEPVFAHLLKLEGNAYQAHLQLEMGGR